MTVSYLVAFHVAIFAARHQPILWISDADTMLDTDSRVGGLGFVLRHFLATLCHVEIGKMALCRANDVDGSAMDIEDAISLPDLCAGAVADFASSAIAANAPVVHSVLQRMPLMVEKARYLMNWISNNSHGLQKHAALVLPAAQGNLTVCHLQIQNVKLGSIWLPPSVHRLSLRPRRQLR